MKTYEHARREELFARVPRRRHLFFNGERRCLCGLPQAHLMVGHPKTFELDLCAMCELLAIDYNLANDGHKLHSGI